MEELRSNVAEQVQIAEGILADQKQILSQLNTNENYTLDFGNLIYAFNLRMLKSMNKLQGAEKELLKKQSKWTFGGIIKGLLLLSLVVGAFSG